MSILSTFNILFLITISILFLSVFGQKQYKQNDNLCLSIRSILCVKTVFSDIVEALKEITITALDIQQRILADELNRVSINEYINGTMKHLQVNLPKSKNHYQFLNVSNNINKTDFIHLMKEENDAFSYIYNSIKNILEIKNIFDKSIDKSFKEILENIHKKILCNYRNILYVYSENWLSINEINGIQILKTRKRRNAPSFLHHSYSIIIIRLINEWMENVNNVFVNIDSKLI